jgi:hypothetical protein
MPEVTGRSLAATMLRWFPAWTWNNFQYHQIASGPATAGQQPVIDLLVVFPVALRPTSLHSSAHGLLRCRTRPGCARYHKVSLARLVAAILESDTTRSRPRSIQQSISDPS